MISSWQHFLTAQGAVIDCASVTHFGDLKSELGAIEAGPVLADLSHFAFIAINGDDAAAFLHGQFTNDVISLSVGEVQWNGYCSPKGRLLATFLLWRTDAGFVMQLPLALRESIQKRLSMFVLRSKVKIADLSEMSVRVGVAGLAARSLLESAGVQVPAAMKIAHADEISVVALDDRRLQISATPERAEEIYKRLANGAVKVGAGRWGWLAIRAGEPWITRSTQEAFVPQMVNFDWLGGVNFRKGCYPGQEIVARTQYLGKLKRRMYFANVIAETVSAGDELFSADFGEQASGMIVNAERSPQGAFDALAVIQIDSAKNQPVHFKTPTGPLLKLREIAYPAP